MEFIFTESDCYTGDVLYEWSCKGLSELGFGTASSVSIQKDEEWNKHTKEKSVFISGPITGVPDYKEKFDKAEKLLSFFGYKVVNPTKIIDPLGDIFTYDQMLELDVKILTMCDCIYQLEGWENSKGANIEFEAAQEYNVHKLSFHVESKKDFDGDIIAQYICKSYNKD